MNVLSGTVGVIACFYGKIEIAFLLMILAAVFDFFDGFSARLLGAYSPVGKELDSLADMISFGLLPTVMLCILTVERGGGGSLFLVANLSVWSCFPFLIAIHSALRLAKFNLDERQHESFLGLATPSCAMICGSLAAYVFHDPNTLLGRWCESFWFIPLLSCILSCLLVSEIPMFSMKFKKEEKLSSPTNIIRIVFVSLIVINLVAVLLLKEYWSLAIFVSFIEYILLNVGLALFCKK